MSISICMICHADPLSDEIFSRKYRDIHHRLSSPYQGETMLLVGNIYIGPKFEIGTLSRVATRVFNVRLLHAFSK